MIRAMIYSLFLIISGIFSSTPSSAYYLTAHDFKFNDINGNELNLKDIKESHTYGKCSFKMWFY
ncbi:hypothetical protein CM15mP43_06380 [bacterium]|nr:MAG: hypothetical protein CM15mP43_06380 [bacterium]